jgi:predicted acetyltransferase
MKLFLVVRQNTAGQCSIIAARSKRDAINKITRLEGCDDAWAIRIEEFMITFKMEENTAFFQPDFDRAVMSMNIANRRGSRGRIFRLKGDAIMKKRKSTNETPATIH